MLTVDYTLSEATASLPPSQRSRITNTYIEQADSTPVPLEVAENVFFFKPTFTLTVFFPPERLVAEGLRYARSMALIPINPEDELRIDTLFKERVGNPTVRKIDNKK